jgi:hypothetical protein
MFIYITPEQKAINEAIDADNAEMDAAGVAADLAAEAAINEGTDL